MANAQVLVLVRSASPIAEADLRMPIDVAARAAGFTVGPSTYNSQAVQVAAQPDGSGLVVGGPWNGDAVGGSPAVPAQGLRLYYNALRVNLLDGPAPTPAQEVSGGWPMDTSAVSAIYRAFPGTRGVRLSFRSPTNSIAWDRGIPDPIALSASSTPRPSSAGQGGLLLGLAAVAGLVYFAGRGTSRMAGLRGTPSDHAIAADDLLAQARRDYAGGYFRSAMNNALRAKQEARWVPGETGEELTRLATKAFKTAQTAAQGSYGRA